MAVGKSPAKNLRAQVTEALALQILNGAFPEGESMPTEGELSQMTGVSRTTLRSAIQTLSAKGMVDVGPSRGTKVQARQFWNLLDGDVMQWRLQLGVTPDLVRQIYEMRECFEPRASFFAAERGTPADHARIAKTFQALEESRSKDQPTATQADVNFHLSILSSSGNDFIISFAALMTSMLRLSFQIARQRRSLSAEDIEMHHDIARAILGRNGAAAEASTHRLLLSSKQVQMDAAAEAERATRVTRALASNMATK